MGRRTILSALGCYAGTLVVTARRPLTAAAQASPAVSGEAIFRERIALPPDAVFTAQLQDVSRADAPATTLSEVSEATAGAEPPFAFNLPYDPAQIDERFSYAVRATVASGGRLLFTTTQRYAVITGGNPTSGLLLLLLMVSGGGSGSGTGGGPATGGGSGQGAGPRARDGQSLRTQSDAVQAAFRAAWGAEADARWAAEHDAELARQGR
jgi:uncharacterized lipoprotein YbaY